ncbi:MAG: hypothetical protein M3Z01_08425 [Thermoproteota archaeon]|nr:hypothetical protein [Thermoproteota archaeon]
MALVRFLVVHTLVSVVNRDLGKTTSKPCGPYQGHDNVAERRFGVLNMSNGTSGSLLLYSIAIKTANKMMDMTIREIVCVVNHSTPISNNN